MNTRRSRASTLFRTTKRRITIPNRYLAQRPVKPHMLLQRVLSLFDHTFTSPHLYSAAISFTSFKGFQTGLPTDSCCLLLLCLCLCLFFCIDIYILTISCTLLICYQLTRTLITKILLSCTCEVLVGELYCEHYSLRFPYKFACIWYGQPKENFFN